MELETFSGRTVPRTNLPLTTQRKDRKNEQTPIIQISFPDQNKGLLRYIKPISDMSVAAMGVGTLLGTHEGLNAK